MASMDLHHIFKQKTHLPEKIKEDDSEKAIFHLDCKTYGFDCTFIASGDIEKIIKRFGEHVLLEHNIDYSDGVLMKFISRKYRNR